MNHSLKSHRIKALKRACQLIDRRIESLEDLSNTFSWIRLGVVISGAVIAIVLHFLIAEMAAWIVIGVFIIAFIFLVRWHNRFKATLKRFRKWKEIKSEHIARATLNWNKIPLPALDKLPQNSAHARDLNLTGARSMHHLIDTAGSQSGSERLLDWITTPVPKPENTQWRNTLIRELEPMTLFRDKLALQTRAESGARIQWGGEYLLRWLGSSNAPTSLGKTLVLLTGLAVLNIILLLLYFFAEFPPVFLITFLLYAGIYLIRYGDFSELFDDIYRIEQLLEPLQSVLFHLERFPYRSGSKLAAFTRPFTSGDSKPSHLIGKLQRLAGLAAISQGNEFLGIAINGLVPWDFYFSRRLDQLKQDIRPQLEIWLDRWYTLEALSSLANYAWLNPEYIYPDFSKENEAKPQFAAEKIGHPLIPENERVRNDFRISDENKITLITGSNMSGKSTFLRTLGVNLQMAYAGTVVDASHFSAVSMQIFTCIQVTDSLNDSISYFYAEVRRLKQLYETIENTDDLPVFYLVDEIFKGTNNRERLIGSRSFIKEIASMEAFGVIATHDLELTQLEEEIAALKNYHFRETIEDSKMAFDYKLHEGPCPTTNALKIMKMEGLPIEQDR